MPRSRRVGLSLAIGLVGLLAISAAAMGTSHDTPGEEATNNLFLIVLLFAVAIGVVVLALIAVATFKFRKRRGHTTSPVNPKTHDSKLEATWTIIPAIILAVVGFATFQALTITDTIPEDPDVIVTITGQRFVWTFRVNDLDANTTTESTSEFTVKVGQVVKLVIESTDVAHSFYVPDFGLKVDAIPGRANVYWFQAVHPGDFELRCAELCGVGHYVMAGMIHVVSA